MASRRGRHSARDRKGADHVAQLPWRRVVNPYEPFRILSQDTVEAMHDASMEVLETLGIEFLDARSLALLEAAGADVDHDSQLVRMDRGLVLDAIAKAPRCFTLYARNPERWIEFGDNHINFDSVGGPPNASDLDGGRRSGNVEDFRNFVRLAQSLNALQACGGVPVAPIELDADDRDELGGPAHGECARHESPGVVHEVISISIANHSERLGELGVDLHQLGRHAANLTDSSDPAGANQRIAGGDQARASERVASQLRLSCRTQVRL